MTPIMAEEPLWAASLLKPAQELFFLNRLQGGSLYAYRAYLYNLETGEVKNKDIDLAETGWHIRIAGADCDCAILGEAAQYNPITGEIYFAVGRGPIGIGDEKPPGSLPDAPFAYAIYKTDFDPVSSLSLFYQRSEFGLLSFILNPMMDTLAIEVKDGPYEGPLQPLINQYNLGDGSIFYLAKFYGENETSELARVSSLGVSPQVDKIYQVFRYRGRADDSDSYAAIVAINVLDRHRESRVMVSGGPFPYDVHRFSAADLARGVSVPFMPPGEVEEAIAWSPEGRYVAFRRDNRYIIFDFQEDIEIDSGIENGLVVIAAQWR
jgi:hypothetical protein